MVGFLWDAPPGFVIACLNPPVGLWVPLDDYGLRWSWLWRWIWYPVNLAVVDAADGKQVFKAGVEPVRAVEDVVNVAGA